MLPGEIDGIIHLAAFNDVRSSQMPEEALLVNGLGTRNMLEIARERKTKFFIYFSTLQVYGKELEGTITIDSPLKCMNDYAFTHYVAEGYCRMYALLYDLNIDIVRPSNIFGCPIHPRIKRWSLVPACFCRSAYEHNEIRLKSSGRQNRDFVSLEFISRCIKFLLAGERKGLNIYNLSSETLFSVLEVVRMAHLGAETILNKKINFICESEYPREPNNFLVKNNLLGRLEKEEVRKSLLAEIEKLLNLLKGNQYE